VRISAVLFVATVAIAPGFAAEALDSAEACLVCGTVHTEAGYRIEYRDQSFPLCSQKCYDEYRLAERTGNLDPITDRIEPRSALIHQDSNPRSRLSNAYFGLGLFILAGLVCGGLSSYVAIQKGMSPPLWFLAGLVLNVFGLLVVTFRAPNETRLSARGRPKMPLTHDEAICPECGHANHPSAGRCIECKAALTPGVPSEVDLARDPDS
jgi:hypothetical protein